MANRASRPKPTEERAIAPVTPTAVATAVARTVRRLSQDNPGWAYPFRTVLPPNDYESAWRTFQLDATTLDKVPASRLLLLLADLSPEFSKALWDFLRFCNPGWEFDCFTLDGDPYPEAKLLIEDFLALLKDLYGSPSVPINRLFFSAFLRGALMAELVIDDAGNMVDLATPDPISARFVTVEDPVRGKIWQLGQLQFTGFVPLDRPTVRYVPVDPPPGTPYGRAIAAAGLFACMFILGMLHDMRKVVAQAGYEHIDIKVISEILRQQMPTEIQDDPKAIQAWTDKVLADISQYVEKLAPDEAFAHTDAIEVDRTEGALNSNAIGGFAGLIEALERMGLRALKSVPLLMGITDGVSEANANRQWEMHLAGVASIQHLGEDLFEGLFKIGLRSRGLQANVRWRFAEIRASEALRDAQTRQIELANILFTYLMGYTTQDQSSLKATGELPAEPEPLLVPKMFVAFSDAASGSATNTSTDIPPESDSTGGEKAATSMTGPQKALQEAAEHFLEVVGAGFTVSPNGH